MLAGTPLLPVPTASAQSGTATFTQLSPSPLVLPGGGGLLLLDAVAEADAEELLITLSLVDPGGREIRVSDSFTMVPEGPDELAGTFEISVASNGRTGWWTAEVDSVTALETGQERALAVHGARSVEFLVYEHEPVAGTSQTPWPQTGGDPSHTGRTVTAGPATVEVERWAFRPDDRQPIHTPVLATDDTIYLATWGGEVYALNQDGQERWDAPLDLDAPVPFPPAMAATGHVLVVTGNGEMHAITPDREIAWTTEAAPEDRFLSPPVLAPDGSIYLMEEPWQLIKVDPVGGSTTQASLEPPIGGAPTPARVPETTSGPPMALTPDGRLIVVADDGVNVLAPNGSIEATIPCDCEPRAVSIAPGIEIALIAATDEVVAVSTRTGDRLWATEGAYGLDGMPWHAPALGWDNDVYIASEDGSVQRVSIDGDFRWSRDLRQPLSGQAVVDANGQLYVAGACGGIWSLSPDRETNWVDDIAVRGCPGLSASLVLTPGGGVLWPAPDGTLRMLGSNRPPVPAFEASWDGQAFVFDASGTTDPDGGPLSYAWDFGQGLTDRGRIVRPELNRPGNYSVTLTVSDGVSTVTRTNEVVINFPPRPVISDESNGLSIQLNATETIDPEQDPITYNWTVDGASAGQGPRLAFEADNPKVFEIALTVSDGFHAVTETRTVLAPAAASWTQETLTLIRGDCQGEICADPARIELVEGGLAEILVGNVVGRTIDVTAAVPAVEGGVSSMRLGPGESGVLHLHAGGIGEKGIGVEVVGDEQRATQIPLIVRPAPATVTWRVLGVDSPLENGREGSVLVSLDGPPPPEASSLELRLLVDDEIRTARTLALDAGTPINRTIALPLTPSSSGELEIQVQVESNDPALIEPRAGDGETGIHTLEVSEASLITQAQRVLEGNVGLLAAGLLAIALAGATALVVVRRTRGRASDETTHHPPKASSPIDGDQTVASSFMPRKVERFEIDRILGEGGFGKTYLAQDTVLERRVVLKELEHVGEGEARELLLHEARTAANLSHANVVVVHDVIEEEGRLLLVMEYVEGGTLADRLGKPHRPGQVLNLLTDIVEGLAALHGAGIVHRDLKPSNILITPDKIPKITDFGVATRIDDGAVEPAEGFVGTPRYMAPEQLAGDPPGPAADVYAAGTILYELLTGRHPLGLDDKTPPPDELLALRPELPIDRLDEDLGKLLERALARDPADRYADANELLKALEAVAVELDEGKASSRTPA